MVTQSFNAVSVFATLQVRTMIVGGHDTTATTISVALHLLAQNPDKQDEAVQELDQVLQGRVSGMHVSVLLNPKEAACYHVQTWAKEVSETSLLRLMFYVTTSRIDC